MIDYWQSHNVRSPAEIKYLCSVLGCREVAVTPLPDLWCRECYPKHLEGHLFRRHVIPQLAEVSK